MQRSDRLEEAGDSEAPKEEATEAEAKEASESSETTAAPARRPRARRARAADTAEAETPAQEAAESPEAEAAPAPRPRARRPRADANQAPTQAAAPPRRTPRRRGAEEEAPAPAPQRVARVPRLLEQYRSRIKPTLQAEFGYGNVMEIPKLEKVVINIGLGEAKTNPRAMENATRDLGLISAQKPVITRARKSISAFKLREGEPIGTAVTLRGNRMYEFMDRLVNAALPRIRDFHGVSRNAFDGRGNYSLGIREQVIFPEIDYGQIDRVRSLQVAIVTTAKTDDQARRLLELIGMPFTRDDIPVGAGTGRG